MKNLFSPFFSFFFIVSIGLGALTVLQATLNRKIAGTIGHPNAILLNSIVVLLILAIVYAYFYFAPSNNPVFQIQTNFLKSLSLLPWWFFLPGLFGFTLVFGAPIIIQKVGALKLFVGFVCGQILMGTIWDYFAEGIDIQPTRIAAALLAILSAFLVNLR